MESLINSIQNIYNSLGIAHQVNEGDLAGLASILFLLIASGTYLLKKEEPVQKRKEEEPLEKKEEVEEVPKEEKVKQESTAEPVKEEKASEEEALPKRAVEEEAAPEPVIEKVEVSAPVEEKVPEPEKVLDVPEEPKISWTQRLKKGLERSRKEVWGKLENIFQQGKGLDADTLEEVEEILYGADIGPSTVAELVEILEEKGKDKDFGPEQFKSFLMEFLTEKMGGIQEGVDHSLYEFSSNETSARPKVIMVVGVNGAGKTTTIGKLATKLTSQGAKVVVGACDTFRAAAVDQLEVWCERAGAKMIRAKEGSNPSGVGFEALQQAINEKADYCILDTAGRLHTAGGLMDELKKSKDVLKKLDTVAPDHVLLVIDAITGQNAIRQAEEFHKTLGLSGLIFTKCDGSSKGGSAVAIVQKLQVPITYIGVGESVEDLNIFNLQDYLKALLNIDSSS